MPSLPTERSFHRNPHTRIIYHRLRRYDPATPVFTEPTTRQYRPLYLRTGQPANLGGARQRIITNLFRSSDHFVRKRSEIGKLVNAGLDGEELYIQTNLGYFKRSLGATSPFIAVSKAEAQPCFRIEKDPAPTVKKLFRDTEAVGVFADAEHVYPAGDNLYWLSIENEAGLFHVADGIGTLKCRLLFDNYNMNLVTRGKRIIPLNDSLVLVSAMQGTLLVNIRELIGNSLGSTPLKFRDSNTSMLPVSITCRSTRNAFLSRTTSRSSMSGQAPRYSPPTTRSATRSKAYLQTGQLGNTTGKSLSCNCRKGGMN